MSQAGVSYSAIAKSRSWAGLSLSGVFWVAVAVLVTYLVAGPVLVLLFSSVRDTSQKLPLEATTYTLANYTQVLLSATTYELLLNTFVYAAGALALSFTLTVIFAWVIDGGRMA